jgi:molecular chaperone GrpE (heat shock protein)
MSVEHGSIRLAKWPFYLADLLLSAVIVFVLHRLGTFEGTNEMLIVAGCLAVAALAAWISIIPWIKEHDASLHLNESSNLKSSVDQIKGIEKVADLIRQSNAQWQGVQDASSRTVTSAREISERMKLEAEEFMKFMANAHDQERSGLRLEVEKLRRMEGDWIKVSVQMLDHVYALFRAAVRSGQQNLIAQLSQFQNACRDVARRMGLAPFMPEIGESFDPRAHQLADPQATPAGGARIQDVLAPGFTYQGQMLRRSLVLLEGGATSQPQAATELSGETEPDRRGSFSPVPPDRESPSIYKPDDENPETASELEVFESIEQLDSPLQPEEQSESNLPPEAPAPYERKKSPQDELPL